MAWLFQITILWSFAHARFELLDYNPVATPQQIVEINNGRFTVLTDRVIRMEYSESKSFEDRATIAFLHRATNFSTFTHTTNNGVLTIKTSSLELSWTIGQPFSASSLSVSSTNRSFTDYHYGDVDPGNLLGTIRTLDGQTNITLNCTENTLSKESVHCEWGLVSRSGFAVVNDTENQALTAGAEWWAGNNTDTLDLYFFGHGQDYRGALADFIQISGRAAMIPRHALGMMWTRWYDINADDLRLIVDQYESRDVPLDITILDMDWHKKNGWDGYSFDKRLFPFPEDELGYVASKGLGFGFNLHDASGVGSFEDEHDAFVAALGLPASTGSVPFNLTDVNYMYALQDIVLTAVRKQASLTSTTWWSDYQQSPQGGGVAGGKQNPTIGINKQRGTEYIRRGETTRPLHLARWGGLGNHRYQVGFSGDVAGLTWTNLAYQPYFSSTAANVGFSQWSHDLEGPSSDHTMYVRWLQWGAYSGTFRSHDRGMSAGGCANTNSCSNVRVWELPTEYFDAARAAMQRREALVPYLYNHVRQAYDTGVTLLRPVYYDFPSEPMAYTANAAGSPAPTYFLGDDMLVAPVVYPSDNVTSMANATIWVPPGKWYEQTSGMLYTVPSGGQVLKKPFDLSETPVFVRAGAVVPVRPLSAHNTVLGLAQLQYTTLGFEVYPGTASGSGYVYEDDGISTDYLSGKSATTTLTYKTTSPSSMDISVSTSGSYPSLPTTRTLIIDLISSLPPTSVKSASANIPYARYGCVGAGPCWTYDGLTLTTSITVPGVATTTGLSLSVSFIAELNEAVLSGVKGAIQHSLLAKRLLDATRITPGCQDTTDHWVMDAAATGDVLSYYANRNSSMFLSTLNGYRTVVNSAITELLSIRPPPPLPASALAQLYDDSRKDHVLCGSSGCLANNGYYKQIRAEGYMPSSTDPDAVPFFDYWNGNKNDNYATSASTPPTGGYSPAVFANGYVLGKAKATGTAPLYVYYNAAEGDHMAVATEDGIAYAKANNYTMVGTAGYVLTEPQMPMEATTTMTMAMDGDLLGGVNLGRWSHAYALLMSAFM